ncbi:hypothetical protein BaRGS_00039776 [Batillaria attramentaria]|uniref:Uncharacterized protein n=1 Tax=Batillaria attramentaria TaxID=370345 RepID=A0ABD0J202_9CAEN
MAYSTSPVSHLVSHAMQYVKDSKTMELYEKTQRQLYNMLRRRRGVYVGATQNPEGRASAHASRFPGRNMHFARTENMQNAEQRLIDACPRCHNIQSGSNVPQKKGFVYIIY